MSFGRGFAALIRQRLGAGALSVCRFGMLVMAVPAIPPLLILGHMRSGSSLLMHILLNHAEITGYGERNTAYRAGEDFRELWLAARARRLTPFRRFRYVVDQINHDRFTPVESLLDDPAVRLIFLTREPLPALTSLLNLTRDFYEAWTPEEALTYYAGRLATLSRIAQGLRDPSRAIALTYERFVDDPRTSLQRLQGFLDLSSGFSEEYKTYSFSGRRGDPSGNIRSGRIVRPGEATAHTAVTEMPDFVLEQARRSYDACRLALECLPV